MTASQAKTQLTNLFDRDYCLWAEQTAQLLREGRFSELDLEHLIEEVEDMSGSQKRSLQSNLRILLMHLLKYQYQSDKRSNSWRSTIVEHRIRLEDAFEESPSLKRYFIEVFDKNYQQARRLVAEETGLAIDTFPEASPFTPEEAIDDNFFPE